MIIITASHFSHFDSVPKQRNTSKNHHHLHRLPSVTAYCLLCLHVRGIYVQFVVRGQSLIFLAQLRRVRQPEWLLIPSSKSMSQARQSDLGHSVMLFSSG